VKYENGKAVDASKYKQIVGCLMYLLATRPDLAYSMCLVARYMERPTEMHLSTVKRILRYLKGTVNYEVIYKKEEKVRLIGWSYSNYVGDTDDWKSTSRYVFMIGNGAISWSSKKQPIVTLSTIEAEYVATTSCYCQGVWLRMILSHLCEDQREATVVYCDNNSSIKLSKNPVMHGRSKHIDVRFHFLRDLTKDGITELKHCNSQDQLADIMIKPLKLEAFCKLRAKLGVIDGLD
jgi:hypothetical protein